MKSQLSPKGVGVRRGRQFWILFALLLALAGIGGWRIAKRTTPVRAQSQSLPRLNLRSARQATATSYKGSVHAMAAVAGRPTALSLAAADLDGDGITDVAIGLASRTGGLIAIHRGNLDAFAPQSDASFWATARGEFPFPYLPEAELVELPGRPDFLASGDFIGLGSSSLAAASRGGQSIYVLARSESGNLELQQTVSTPGPITALDGHPLTHGKYWQCVVGVHTAAGSQLVVYTGSHDGLSQTASFPLPGDATSFASGNLDGDNVADLLVVAGGQVLILHGQSQRLEPVSLPYPVSSAALGNFIYDRDPVQQMALIASDGSVHVLAWQGFNSTPFTSDEMRARRVAQLAQPRNRPKLPAGAGAERSITWKEVESYADLGASGGNGKPPIMFRTRISSNGADDLAFLDASRFSVLSHGNDNPKLGSVTHRTDLAADAVAALPVRVNVDARPGVVSVARGEIEPVVLQAGADPTFNVNTTSDFVSSNPNACLNAVANQCSLREAIVEANAEPAGTTVNISLQAATYTLTIPRNCPNNTCAYDAKTGTLDVNISGTLNITGAGQNSTIIQAGSQGASNSPNGVDKVFSFNQDILSFTSASVSLSALTIQNGFNRGNMTITDGWGGAFDFDTGLSGNQTVTMTNVTISSNTLTQGEGGGIAIFNTNGGTGGLTAANCIIQNNIAAPNATDGSGEEGGNGGGIAVLGSGRLTLTTSTVSGNQTKAAGGSFAVGGGIAYFGGEFSGTTFVNGQMTLNGDAIANNIASAQGGGIYGGDGFTIQASGAILSSVTGNTAGGDGGGIFVAPFGSGESQIVVPAVISNVTITGNSTTGAAGNSGSPQGYGGGVKFDGDPNITTSTLNMSFSRLTGNSCTISAGGSCLNGINLSVQGGVASVADNWWGFNTDPVSGASPTIGIDTNGGESQTINYKPWLVLGLSANPTTVTNNGSDTSNDTSTLTATVLKDSNGGTVSVSNLAVLIGLPITFPNPLDGTISNPQAAIQSNGTATATFTGTKVGTGSAQAKVDNAVATTNIIVNSNTATAAVNQSATFNTANQNVTLNATLTATTGDTVAGGTVTFKVFNGSTQIGANAVSGTVAGGAASATFVLPGGTNAGTYTIQATYSGTSTGTGDFLASSDTTNTHTLTVNPASTTTTASNATATFSSSTQSVTLNATVTSPGGTVGAGTVTFTVLNGATPVGSATTSGTVTGGSASVSYSLPASTPAGTYTIQAVYNASTNFSGSSDNTHTLAISAATTTTASNVTVTFSATNQTVPLSATVTSGGGTVNVGTVTFSVFNGATQIGSSTSPASVTSGSASANYTLPGGTNAGTYTIVANYTGAGGFNNSSDNTHTLTVNAAGTTTTAANASTNFSASAQSVTLNATVTSTAGTVGAGTVTFTVLNGATPVGSATTSGTVTAGNASVNYGLPAGTPAGVYTIQAVYNGSTNFSGSSDNTHTLTITAGTTTTASNATATFNANNQTVTLSATVTSGGTVNVGTVTFSVFNGATQIGSSVTSGTVTNGVASASYTLPGGTSAGTYSIHASYSGGTGFAASSDNTHTLTVSQASTTTTAANATISFSASVQTVTLNATVTSPGGTVNAGTVTFTVLNGGTPVGSATTSSALTTGSASVSYTIPAGTPTGTYTIQAVYNGSTNFAGSSDNTHTLAIGGGSTTTTASNASTTFSPGNQLVTLAATVTSSGGTVNAGTMTFSVFNGGTLIGSSTTVNVTNGSASANYTLPGGTPAGTYTIVASYNGAGGFGSSSDNTHTLTVGKATPVITWSNPASVTFGSALSSEELNAAANVPGTFVYTPPAGTVLPVGNNQTLSVQFTPADTTDYNGASASVQISVTAAIGPATLVLSDTLTRDSGTNNVIVTLTIANTGGSPATNVQVTSANIGSTVTLTPLPLPVPDVPAGGSSTLVLTFPASVGTTGSRAVLSINGSYNGGQFGGSARVVLP